jgi:putative hydrolase of the HAD superfamily
MEDRPTLPAVEAVLFDLYDTLVWTEWSKIRERLAETTGLTPRDLMRGFVETREARGIGTFGSFQGDLAAVLRTAGGDPNDQQVRALAALELRTLIDGGVHLYDDSLPVLRELRRRGIATAIVSNCDHGTRPIVDSLRLEDEVDAVVLSFEVHVMKPDPAIYLATLERVGGDVATSTFVDDQPTYLDGAAALGLRTFQIIRPADPNAPPPDAHPVIEDLWAVVPEE